MKLAWNGICDESVTMLARSSILIALLCFHHIAVWSRVVFGVCHHKPGYHGAFLLACDRAS